MKFVKASEYHMESDCGSYYVSKAFADRWHYSAWCRTSSAAPPQDLATVDTAAEAQAVCEAHRKATKPLVARTFDSIDLFMESQRG